MQHVAVLMGGWSAEREVSLASGKACANALESQGYRVTRIDVDRDIASVLKNLNPMRPSTCCMGGPVRTARFRACSKCWRFRTATPAYSPRLSR